MRSAGSNVGTVGFVHRLQGVIGSVAVILFSFVVHKSHVKPILSRNLLQQGITAVEKRTPLAVPIDRESINTQILGLLNLFPQYVGILRGISHVDMLLVPKPGLVIGDDPGSTGSAAHSLIERAAGDWLWPPASARQNKEDRCKNHRDEQSALHFQVHSPCSDNFASILL